MSVTDAIHNSLIFSVLLLGNLIDFTWIQGTKAGSKERKSKRLNEKTAVMRNFYNLVGKI